MTMPTLDMAMEPIEQEQRTIVRMGIVEMNRRRATRFDKGIERLKAVDLPDLCRVSHLTIDVALTPMV